MTHDAHTTFACICTANCSEQLWGMGHAAVCLQAAARCLTTGLTCSRVDSLACCGPGQRWCRPSRTARTCLSSRWWCPQRTQSGVSGGPPFLPLRRQWFGGQCFFTLTLALTQFQEGEGDEWLQHCICNSAGVHGHSAKVWLKGRAFVYLAV